MDIILFLESMGIFMSVLQYNLGLIYFTIGVVFSSASTTVSQSEICLLMQIFRLEVIAGFHARVNVLVAVG